MHTTKKGCVNAIKKTLLILLILALSAAGCSASGETGPAAPAVRMEAGTIPLYLFSADNRQDLPVRFRDGQTDIPYIDGDTVCMLLNLLGECVGLQDHQVTMEREGAIWRFSRENGSHAYLDFEQSVAGWDDFDRFVAVTRFPMDLVSSPDRDEAGRPHLFQRGADSRYRPAGSMSVSLKEQFHIRFFYINGKGYLPLQTFSDLFLSPYSVNIGYNGQAAFLFADNLSDLAELYYDVEPGPRSQTLADFTYDETCLVLQFSYGLKDTHNLSALATRPGMVGIERRLRSTDALEADVALYDMINGCINDPHSDLVAPSPYAGYVQVSPTVQAGRRDRLIADGRMLSGEAAKFYPDGIPAYEEIDNTAYIYFRQYSIAGVDYYAALENGEEPVDTISLIMYAHGQITREDSPIENVVLDMSLNTGGAMDAAVFTIGWFLGECDVNLINGVNGARATNIYRVDVNGDRVFDEKDSIAHLNRYCIISPVSFSNGNFVACALKSSNQVTLLGRRSGGGAGIVQPQAAADGTIWRLSSRNQLGILSNGSFCSVEQGVEPDYRISSAEDFYHRVKLTEFINSLR